MFFEFCFYFKKISFVGLVSKFCKLLVNRVETNNYDFYLDIFLNVKNKAQKLTFQNLLGKNKKKLFSQFLTFGTNQ